MSKYCLFLIVIYYLTGGNNSMSRFCKFGKLHVTKGNVDKLLGKCPKCGNNIVLKKSFYGCSNYPECTFTLAEHFRKKKLTKTNVKELLEGKETLVKGIKTKDRKSYNAVVKIGEKGYIDFIYV